MERATRLLNALGADKEITKVETADDTTVYSGVTSTEFVSRGHFTVKFQDDILLGCMPDWPKSNSGS